jgi:hypothetical protein
MALVKFTVLLFRDVAFVNLQDHAGPGLSVGHMAEPTYATASEGNLFCNSFAPKVGTLAVLLRVLDTSPMGGLGRFGLCLCTAEGDPHPR